MKNVVECGEKQILVVVQSTSFLLRSSLAGNSISDSSTSLEAISLEPAVYLQYT